MIIIYEKNKILVEINNKELFAENLARNNGIKVKISEDELFHILQEVDSSEYKIRNFKNFKQVFKENIMQ
jgi:hypothetical protein